MLLDAAREMIASYREEGREPPIGGGHTEQLTIELAAAQGVRISSDICRNTVARSPARARGDLSNAERDLRAPVPRHREIPLGTSRAICRQLGVEAPGGR